MGALARVGRHPACAMCCLSSGPFLRFRYTPGPFAPNTLQFCFQGSGEGRKVMLRFFRALSGAMLVAALAAGCGGGSSSDTAAVVPPAAAAPPMADPVPAYPFGGRLQTYNAGIQVTSADRTALDQKIGSWYSEWKAARIVWNGSQAYDAFNNANCSYVSEGMGYAMLLAVTMAGGPYGDANAKTLFDGLLATVAAHPATTDITATFTDGGQTLNARDYLMAWCVGGSNPDAYNAVDGDLDIALALLMADKQWGSNGISGSPQNYKQRATRTIAAIKLVNMDADTGAVLSRGQYFKPQGMTRSSDLMIGHFRSFYAATGDTFWTDKVIPRSFALIADMQEHHALDANGQTTGLLPDWIKYSATANPTDALPYPPGDSPSAEPTAFTDAYGQNAFRDPWRFASDYVYSADPRWSGTNGYLTRIARFFNTQWTDTSRPNPAAPGAGPGPADKMSQLTGLYKLDGTRFSPAEPLTGMAAGVMAAAMVDPQFQTLLDNSWSWELLWKTTGYYDSELALLGMIVASGNWWIPEGSNAPPPPPPPPSSTTIQAEDASRTSDLAVQSGVAGYTGTGYVGYGGTGTTTATFQGVTAGSYDIQIRYHAYTPQEENVIVNGASPVVVAFAASDPSWSTVTLSGVRLAQGANTIAVAAGWGYIDLDSISIQPTGGGSSGGGGTMTSSRVYAGAGTMNGVAAAGSPLTGYDGAGYVGDFSQAGSWLDLHFDNMAAGTYTVTIRYHVYNDEHNNVTVNGGAAQEVDFPLQGSNLGWQNVQLTAQLAAGASTIRIAKNWGYMEVNWVQVDKTS